MIAALEKVNIIPAADATLSMPVPQATSENQLLAVLSRMLADPSVDLDRIERAEALYERASKRNAETAFNTAMANAQEEMRPIAANANNPQTKSRYAKYDALDNAVRPIYSKYGFSLMFYQGEGAPEGHIRVQCKLSCGGHTERPYLDMPADGKGAKGGDVMTKTHATGAGVTYGRRYLLGMIFNLVIGEDNDGNMPADAGGSITMEQAKEIAEKCNEVAEGFDESFCNYFGIKAITDLPAREYQRAIVAIGKKRAAK